MDVSHSCIHILACMQVMYFFFPEHPQRTVHPKLGQLSACEYVYMPKHKNMYTYLNLYTCVHKRNLDTCMHTCRYAGPETGLGAINGTNAAIVDAAKDMEPKGSDQIKKFWCVCVCMCVCACVLVFSCKGQTRSRSSGVCVSVCACVCMCVCVC